MLAQFGNNLKNVSTKSNTPPWVFFTFLSCTNGSKSCKATHNYTYDTS